MKLNYNLAAHLILVLLAFPIYARDIIEAVGILVFVFTTGALSYFIWNAQGLLFLKSFSLFFWISYTYRLNMIMADNSVFNLGGMYSTGNFNLNSDNLYSYLFVAALGFFSVVAGFLISHRINLKILSFTLPTKLSIKTDTLLVILVLTKLLFSLVNFNLGIGISGQRPPILFPGMVGLFFAINTLLLPITFGAFLLELSKNRKWAKFLLFGFVVLSLAVIDVIISKSKVGLIFPLLPLLLASIILSREVFPPKFKFLLGGATISPLIILSFFTIDHIRTFDSSLVEAVFHTIRVSVASVSDLVFIVHSFLARISGGAELLAVIHSETKVENVIPKLITSRDFALIDMPNIIKEIFSIDVGVKDDGSFTGKTLGLLGAAYLNKNIFIFVLTLTLIGMAINELEKFVSKNTNASFCFSLMSYFAVNTLEAGFDIIHIYIFAIFGSSIIFMLQRDVSK